MSYKIRCYVSGGLTGTDEAWYKEHGKMFVTSHKSKAQKRVKEYNDKMNTIYSTATFRAKVVKLS